MLEKTVKLFNYINETLDLIKDGHIDSKFGKTILKNMENELTNKSQIYPHINSFETKNNDYWYDFLFKDNDSVVDYFKFLSNRDSRNRELIHKLAERFLSMPSDIKKDFYQSNLVFISRETRGTVHASMCGKSFEKADPDTIFHNLPSIFLLNTPFITSERSEESYNLFNKICTDMKDVLKISHDKFIDVYGPALVYTVDSRYIHDNWDSFQMKTNKNMQEAFATKFFFKRLKGDSFLNFVEKGLLPYDVRLPRNGMYLMNAAIAQKLDEVSSCLSETPFSEKSLTIRVQHTKKFMTEIVEKHNLYFVDKEVFNSTIKNLSNHLKNNFNKDRGMRSRIEKDMLDFFLSMEDLLNGKKQKIEKKIKI